MSIPLPLAPLENFECDGDTYSIGPKWEKWKRGLCLYLEAASIEDPKKKRATMLHMGGLGLQEIYYNIPGAHASDADESGNDVFSIALQKLDEYFAPKKSYVYERHVFRIMKQEPEEKFEKFLIRLRRQAARCGFTNPEEHLIDQVTEKCSSEELRKKILKAGDGITLKDIIIEANTLENVKRQLEDFTQNPSTSNVNMINRKREDRQRKFTQNISCFNCGGKHFASHDGCPGRNVTCNKCGFEGHFAKFCRFYRNSSNRSAPKRKPETSNEKYEAKRTKQNTAPKKRRVNEIEQIGESDGSEEIDYVFHVDDDSLVSCTVGGKRINLLIDSGCKCNLMTDKTWELMKKEKFDAKNINKSSNKTFYAYGSKEPLVVLGSFQSTIMINNNIDFAKFYVIKGGTKDILGKNSAIALGVLKLGAQVNALNCEQEKERTQSSATFPKFKDVLVRIPIDKKVTPVIQPYRRMPIPLEDKVNAKIQELLELDIIEEVGEPAQWVSPMVPILKENGDVRICIDMRKANAAIIRENHPLPTMDQLLPKFRKAKKFSRLDIKNAFHQIEIHPDTRYITTFITSRGMFRYKRLMFGISCAPELFQKIMEHTLIKCEGTMNFIDDIIIFGCNDEEHDKRLENALQTLKDKNVLLNNDKCVYKVNKIEFLGHELSDKGVTPLKKYINNIQTFRPPSTVEELQSFLGLVNYVNKWIPNFATLTEPLRKILKLKLARNATIGKVWSKEQDEAFNELKKSLTNIKTLGYYDPQDKTQVLADASPVALGSVLVQKNSYGPRIIAFGNKSLTEVEQRYCQTEKEALALVWAVEHFNIYLYGLKEFELISDHKPLEVIFGKNSKPCARIERWVLRLQAYNYKIVYQPGKSNIADPLSRLPTTEYNSVNPILEENEQLINQIIEYSRPVAVPLEDIVRFSRQDSEIAKVKRGLYENIWDPAVTNYKVFETELCMQNNILLRGNKIVIPEYLRKKVLDAAHEGHPGIVCMKQRLRTKVWWPKIDKDAERVVRNCRGCTLVSAPNPPVPMKRRELPSEPWIDVAIDLLGPLPTGDYLLVVIDYYSRYKEIKDTKDISSTKIIKLLKEIFSRLGFPISISADNGRQFTSQEFKKYLGECGITLHNSIPYWPQQNGEVERQNRSILKRIKISQIEKRNWKDDLLQYLMMYNGTPHTVTGKPPAELFFNRAFRDKIPSFMDIENNEINLEVADTDKIRKEKGKTYSDRKRKARNHSLNDGDKVFVKNFNDQGKLSANFSPTTHTVVRSSQNSGDVEVRNDETGKCYRRNVVHLKKLTENGESKIEGKIMKQPLTQKGTIKF